MRKFLTALLMLPIATTAHAATANYTVYTHDANGGIVATDYTAPAADTRDTAPDTTVNTYSDNWHWFSSMGGHNPLFGDTKNQIAFNIGQGVNSGFLLGPPWRFVPYTTLHFQYSQPATFFRLPSRWSVNVSLNAGYGDRYGWDWDDYFAGIGYLSTDIPFVFVGRFYSGFGIGVGMQVHQNPREDSKLLFQFKWFLGYKLTDNTAIELFAQHFSNGNVTPQSGNNSYDFWGIGYNWNF